MGAMKQPMSAVTNIPAIQQRSVEELIDRNLLHHKRSMDEIMDRFRNSVIVRALAIHAGNITRTAQTLKTNRTTLVRWMDQFGLRGVEDNGKDRETDF
jgi:DNA-binding NtrC family response regulator